MRKPNGYGCIKKLSGNRRRPYVFVISINGKQKPVEYFPTQTEAEIYDADYNKLHNHHSLPGHQITFAELYYRWLNRHITDTSPSSSAINGYRNSFSHCSSIQGMDYTELRYSEYQRVLDDMRKSGLSYSSVKKVRSIFSLMEKYANKNEINNKNNASLLSALEAR